MKRFFDFCMDRMSAACVCTGLCCWFVVLTVYRSNYPGGRVGVRAYNIVWRKKTGVISQLKSAARRFTAIKDGSPVLHSSNP